MLVILKKISVQTQIKKILLIFLLVFITQITYSQKITESQESTSIYKNAIKGLVTIVPYPGFFLSSLSIGYERKLSRHSVFELGSFYLLNTDEMGVVYHNISVMPAYKYYLISKKKGVNNFWISGYISFIYSTHKYEESNNRHSLYYYGLGGSIGKRFHLSKNKKWFLDLGLGVSFNIYDDKQIFTNNDWANEVIPRPILQIGRKF